MTEELRGTGRTTALMLRSISDAILSPVQWVEFVDHGEMLPSVARAIAGELVDLCDSIGLHEMLVSVSGGRVFVLLDPSGKRTTVHHDPAFQLPDLPE